MNEGLVRVLVENIDGRLSNAAAADFILAAWPDASISQCAAAQQEAERRVAAQRRAKDLCAAASATPAPTLGQITEWLITYGVETPLPWPDVTPGQIGLALDTADELATADAAAAKAGLT